MGRVRGPLAFALTRLGAGLYPWGHGCHRAEAEDRPPRRARNEGLRKRGREGHGGPAEPGPDGAGRAAFFGLSAPNLVLLGAALVSLVAGYVLLDRGSITAAPILLVLGYVVLVPAGLLVGMERAGSKE